MKDAVLDRCLELRELFLGDGDFKRFGLDVEVEFWLALLNNDPAHEPDQESAMKAKGILPSDVVRSALDRRANDVLLNRHASVSTFANPTPIVHCILVHISSHSHERNRKQR